MVAGGCGGDDGDDVASSTTGAGDTTTTAAAGEGGVDGGEEGDGQGGAGGGSSTTTRRGSGGGGATTTAAGAATTTTSPIAADLAEIVFRPADFPAGWTSEPSDDQDGEETEKALEQCLGIQVDGIRPDARSPDFSVADAITRASSAVELAPDIATVDREFAAITGPRFLDCAAKQFDAELARQAPGAQLSPSKAERIPFPAQGEGTAAVRLSITLTAGDQSVPFFADLVFVRKGLLELSFSFVNAGEPFNAALEADLVGKVTARA